MSASRYEPQKHRRRSIRLKGHDYAGGGLYFVTVCAHREFVEFAKGHPFGNVGARFIAPWEGAPCVSPGVGARSISPSSGRTGPTQVSPGVGAKSIPPAAGPAGPTGPTGPTQVSPVRELIEERLRITAEKFPFMKWEEVAIMPDHMHALIRMEGGHQRLGDVVGGFKAAVSREMHRGADISVAPDIRIWHRNYYETIVRAPEAEKNIRVYIRLNPWKLVQQAAHEGGSLRMIGNPALWSRLKTAVLCSRRCPDSVLIAAKRRASNAGADRCFIGGFHSPPEKSILDALLGSQAKLICCPAWGIDTMRMPAEWLPALEANRMLIVEIRAREAGVGPLAGDLAAAEQRNRFVLEQAENRWLPHVEPRGMLDRLVKATHSSPQPRQRPAS